MYSNPRAIYSYYLVTATLPAPTNHTNHLKKEVSLMVLQIQIFPLSFTSLRDWHLVQLVLLDVFTNLVHCNALLIPFTSSRSSINKFLFQDFLQAYCWHVILRKLYATTIYLTPSFYHGATSIWDVLRKTNSFKCFPLRDCLVLWGMGCSGGMANSAFVRPTHFSFRPFNNIHIFS